MVRHTRDGKKRGENLGGLMTWYQLCWCHGVVGCEHSRGKVPRDRLSREVEVTKQLIRLPMAEELNDVSVDPRH
jgi:hypothetical protein